MTIERNISRNQASKTEKKSWKEGQEKNQTYGKYIFKHYNSTL